MVPILSSSLVCTKMYLASFVKMHTVCFIGMEMIHIARGRWELALRRLEDAGSLVCIYFVDCLFIMSLSI